MEIFGEFMGKDPDKSLWRYFCNHWYGWFPNLGSRSSFVKQSANLLLLKERIQKHLAWQMGAVNDPIHWVDGFPMPVCKITRVEQSREAGYGYCAAKDGKCYGFEGHVVVNIDGIICGYTFAPPLLMSVTCSKT